MFEDTIFMGFTPGHYCGGMTVMLIVQVPIVGWFALPMVALFVGVSIYLALKVNMPRFKSEEMALGATIADIMTAMPTVKSFAGERREDAHFAGVAGEWRKRAQNAWLIHVIVDFARTHIRIALMIGMTRHDSHVVARQGDAG